MAKCLKCRGPVADDQAICGNCNPAKIAAPARTQVHGTMVGILLIGAAAAAIIGSQFISADAGQAVFEAAIVDEFRTSADVMTVVVEVANNGSEATSARCRVVAQDGAGRLLADGSAETATIGVDRVEAIEVDLDTDSNPQKLTARCR